MFTDQGDNALGFARDRQRWLDPCSRQRRGHRRARGQRRRQRLLETPARARVPRLRAPARPQPQQAAAVAGAGAVDGGAAVLQRRRHRIDSLNRSIH
jgi:hypothetical protein